MQIDIQARHFSLTDSIRAHVLKRLGFTLGSRHQDIERIQVKLSDINGPKGGKDKRCLIQVFLPRLKNVVIQYTESDLYVAIDHAANRASRTVSRRLGQKRNFDRTLHIQDKYSTPHPEDDEYFYEDEWQTA